MTTWSEISTRLDAFLNDTTGEDFTDAQRMVGWNAAQRLLAVHHTPREQSMGLVLMASGRQAALPATCIDVKGIYDGDASRWWAKMVVAPETGYRLSDAQARLFWVWDRNLYLERDVESTDDLTLYYYAYWPDIARDEDVILIPGWAELPCMHFTAAYCLQQGSLEAADIRQWLGPADRGNPIQNPRAVQAREHWWWWTTLLSQVKPLDR